MDSGYYAAMTGLIARMQALDAAAANLANAQTPGYRAEREFFRSALLGPDSADSQLGETMNNYGLLGGDSISAAQGSLQETGNPLDLALIGQGFFEVQTQQGPRFTRDGTFERSQKGFLVTSGGEPVLSATGQAIALPPGKISVGTDGSISVSGGLVATVGVFTFPKDVVLSAEGANRYVPPVGTKPSLADHFAVRQGAIEGANEDVIQGTMDLMMMQRQAEMMQKALTDFHSDFNKFATEDLPRV